MLYTPEKIEQLKTAIAHLAPQWGLDENAPVKLLNVSENATFIHGENQKKRIIRAYRPFYHDDIEIHSELCWMQSLERENIVSIPQILPWYNAPSPHENTHLASIIIDDIPWRFAAFSYLQGEHPHINNDLVKWFKHLGKISARLHLQAQHWQRPKNFVRKMWTHDTMIGPNAYWGDWKKIPNISSHDFVILQICVEKLRNIEHTFPRDNAHFGLIHGDLRLANLLIQDKHLCILDFDDCGFSWYAADLANALSFMEDNPVVPDLIQSWFKGYGEISTFSPIMQSLVPHLIIMRRIQLSAWLVSHEDSSPLQKISKNFHNKTIELAKQYLEKSYFKES